MSWLAQRWRTQRTAIRSVNCRIQWIIRLLNAKGAVEVFPRQHVCFSVFQCHITCAVNQLLDSLWGHTGNSLDASRLEFWQSVDFVVLYIQWNGSKGEKQERKMTFWAFRGSVYCSFVVSHWASLDIKHAKIIRDGETASLIICNRSRE